MKVVRHHTASKFLDRAGAWLESAEAENNLILGIAAYFRSYIGQLTVEPYFLTLEASGAILGAALMTPPRRLLLTTMPDPAVTTLADFMLAETVTVPGALGPRFETRLFTDYWRSRTGRLCHARMSGRIYTCETVAPLKHAPGRLRPATNDDEPLLSEWCVQFCLDARIEDETVYFKARLPSKTADGSLFIWENDDPVAMAGLERETAHGIAISWVYTPRHLRRSGYATACVATLTQRILNGGKKFCCLYTDLANPASNSIYQKIGYRPVCDVQDWIFE